MNLLLLLPEDLLAPGLARVQGRRLRHAQEVLRSQGGDRLTVGLVGGRMGTARVQTLTADFMDLDFEVGIDPPPKVPLTLVLALPRPKVLNRVLASAASLGVARIVLVNAWKVEKSYWNSPRMSPENLREQLILGLEQSRDTVLPDLQVERLFMPFLETRLPLLLDGARGLVGDPGAPSACPRALNCPVVLAVGPEGGWIPGELSRLTTLGFEAVSLGPRALRTETAVATLVGRLT